MAETEGQNNQVRVAFRIGYLGSSFYGSQFQPHHRTVEGEIRQACIRAGLFTDTREGRLAFSGRTDRGVHARDQIIAFSTPYPDRARRALPGQLPPDIWVEAFCEVPECYSPRRDVITRTYRFYYADKPGDLELMRSAAALCLGRHDYSCFARMEPGKDPMRSITTLNVHEESDCYWLEVSAQSFLWHMVRSMAAALSRVSTGQTSLQELEVMLTGRCNNKMRPAPPDGLILWEITDELPWRRVPPLNRTFRLHADAAAEHRLMARVHQLLSPGLDFGSV
ncbi:MAG: tRNA pseudouridine(38-40) synthase TruA [Methanospirillum sp.]|uniref:tRNA pseudouridine(38-40) synthase TruA n=1 Tax=Methanospirillum sp. TaxID=45200 RepID=UPI0023757B9E|nr:tRNA pseudouridine(38-40) synthase TruA [Methanospirillum sp.]MDD1728891.1 tRNA pseudouridine(38-40) synthase TruA [Methanospirillum sp.]